MEAKIFLFCCLFLLGCESCNQCCDRMSQIERHEKKLRRHFSGERVEDISTLISETKSISCQLKRSGRMREANRFDSYVDVLTYGNRTVDESLDDVMRLINRGAGNAKTDDCENIFFVK